MTRIESYTDQMARLFPNSKGKMPRTVTWQVVDSCNLQCTYCVVAGTKILMADGKEKAIETIDPGDIVRGIFGETAEVIRTISRVAEKVYKINGNLLTITGNHLVFSRRKDSKEKGFSAIEDLKVGDFLFSSKGKEVEILSISEGNKEEVFNIETSCGTYFANGIAVHNCYQINKKNHEMSWDVAKRFCDLVLSDNGYIDSSNSNGLIMEFIGGEPFLAVDLMDKICDYMIGKMIEMQHPWATRYMVSVCSNGVLYFDKKVQNFLEKHKNHLSFSISIDGCKELHDACRVFPDGRGSYDIAMAGVKHFRQHFKGQMGSKMTLAPGNIGFTFKAVKSLIENGYDEINLNCVYEEGWTAVHAKILYEELKKVADYIALNDLFDKVKLSIFEERFFCPKDEKDEKNWCWGIGTPILTNQGYKNIEDIKLGDLVYTHDGTLQPVIDLKKHFADNVVNLKCPGVFELTATDNHKLFTKPFGNKHYQKTELKDIKHNDLIKLFNNVSGDKINYPVELAYLVGRFIGDGTQNGKSIVCSFNEEDSLKEYFNKANIEYSIYNGKTVKEFHIIKTSTNNQLNEVLAKCAENKQLPIEVLNWTKESQEALLQGYIDADGEQFRFNTVSYKLAQEMMVLLRILGYNPTCKRRDDRYEVYVNRSKYVHHDNNNDCWTYGLKIEPAEPQIVYNLTVANNHSYIAGGIVSSNCGGLGDMLSCDWKGDLYPCIRYMESSLGDEVESIKIGNVYRGILKTKEEQELMHCMKCVTRRSQSTDECFYCPIAEGCSWCSAYNYQDTGSFDKRATHICIMHKARALANVYFWNLKFLLKEEKSKVFKNWMPDEWALEILSADCSQEEAKEELERLKVLARA